MSCKYRLMYQFSYINFSSTNQDTSLVLLDGPSRVRSQITSVLCPKTLVLCMVLCTKFSTGSVYRPGVPTRTSASIAVLRI